VLRDATEPSFALVETNRGPLWTRQCGTGPDVLAISGLGDTHEIWDAVTPLLTQAFRVTVFDNRGVGRSPAPGETPTIRGFAEDALALMRSLDISNANIVGSSMGGAIAQELALAEPARAASLVLAGTWSTPDVHLSRLLRHMTRLIERIEDPRELIEAMCLWVYSGRAHADGTVDLLIRSMQNSASPPQSSEMFALTAEAAIAHDATDRLRSLDIPTLVLVGGEDRICPPRLSRQLHSLIAGSRLYVMPGRGHQAFQEDPAAFVHAIRAFWSHV
jgi:pimeloyl-ACP methyl ester carboxylesterase